MQAAETQCALKINEGLSIMRTAITLVTVNQVAFALIRVGCQQCLWEGVTTAISISQQLLLNGR